MSEFFYMSESKQTKLDINGIATYAALILSLVAISISLLEVSTMRTQQHASVWPYLQIKSSYSAEGFQTFIENKGVGPAMIKRFNVKVDDKIVEGFDQIVVAVVGQQNAFSYDIYQASDPDKSVLSAGEQFRLFSVPLQTKGEEKKTFKPGVLFAQESFKRVEISLCYCSIYEHCWLSSSQQTEVKETKSCK